MRVYRKQNHIHVREVWKEFEFKNIFKEFAFIFTQIHTRSIFQIQGGGPGC